MATKIPKYHRQKRKKSTDSKPRTVYDLHIGIWRPSFTEEKSPILGTMAWYEAQDRTEMTAETTK